MCLVALLPGCGLIFQLYAGYDREETRTEEQTQTMFLTSLPRGAHVDELTGEARVSLGTTPVEKQITYQREVTTQLPASMTPFWIGTAIDAALLVGTGVLIDRVINPEIERREGRDFVWGVFSQLVLGLVAEVVVGGIVGGRPPSVIKRRDIPAAIDLAFLHPNGVEIQAHVEVPAAGDRLTIPLDPSAARHLNRPGAPVTLFVAKTSSTAAR
jgi:hypothetical protein